VVSCC